jgi:hypothetical protein
VWPEGLGKFKILLHRVSNRVLLTIVNNILFGGGSRGVQCRMIRSNMNDELDGTRKEPIVD